MSSTAHHFSTVVPTTLNYLQHLPPDYDPSQRYPLILALHGSGERGDDLEKLKVNGMPAYVEQHPDFPAIVIMPQCPAESWWTYHIRALAALLDHIEGDLSVDPDRIYLSGLSMGTWGLWSLAILQPERFAALVPICGRGEPHLVAVLKNVPVWVFHGALDEIVLPVESEAMVAALRWHGNSRVKYTLYPDVGHDAWTPTYNNPELFAWLFAQKRGQ